MVIKIVIELGKRIKLNADHFNKDLENVKKTKCLNVINVEFIHMTPLTEKALRRPISKFIVFLIVMYRYESWTIKMAEC